MCTRCGKEIEKSTSYKVLAVERPYATLLFHADCYEEILKEAGGWDGLALYLANNLSMWYNIGE